MHHVGCREQPRSTQGDSDALEPIVYQGFLMLITVGGVYLTRQPVSDTILVLRMINPPIVKFAM